MAQECARPSANVELEPSRERVAAGGVESVLLGALGAESRALVADARTSFEGRAHAAHATSAHTQTTRFTLANITVQPSCGSAKNLARACCEKTRITSGRTSSGSSLYSSSVIPSDGRSG